jgi:predicted restriction endonuclease
VTDLLLYLRRFHRKNLKRAPATERSTWSEGESPYKVILIISIVSAMHREKAFRSGIIYFEDCIPRFRKLYETLYPSEKVDSWEPKTVQPFWYFGAGRPRIWSLVPKEGKTAELKRAIAGRKQIKTETQLNSLVECAEFDPGDFDLLQDPTAAKTLVGFLMAEYFHESKSLSKVLSIYAGIE